MPTTERKGLVGGVEATITVHNGAEYLTLTEVVRLCRLSGRGAQWKTNIVRAGILNLFPNALLEKHDNNSPWLVPVQDYLNVQWPDEAFSIKTRTIEGVQATVRVSRSGEEYLTLYEVARLNKALNRAPSHPSRAYALCREGRYQGAITAPFEGKRASWLVPVSSYLAYHAEKPRRTDLDAKGLQLSAVKYKGVSYLTLAVAAELVKRPRGTVLNWIRTGKLPGALTSPQALIPVASYSILQSLSKRTEGRATTHKRTRPRNAYASLLNATPIGAEVTVPLSPSDNRAEVLRLIKRTATRLGKRIEVLNSKELRFRVLEE